MLGVSERSIRRMLPDLESKKYIRILFDSPKRGIVLDETLGVLSNAPKVHKEWAESAHKNSDETAQNDANPGQNADSFICNTRRFVQKPVAKETVGQNADTFKCDECIDTYLYSQKKPLLQAVNELLASSKQYEGCLLDKTPNVSNETEHIINTNNNLVIQYIQGVEGKEGGVGGEKEEEGNGEKKAGDKKTRKTQTTDFDRQAARAFTELFRSWGAPAGGRNDATHLRKVRQAIQRTGVTEAQAQDQVRGIYRYLAKRGAAQHGSYAVEILSCAALYQKITKLAGEIRRDEERRNTPSPSQGGRSQGFDPHRWFKQLSEDSGQSLPGQA